MFSRLVNMLHISISDHDSFWNIVKQIRKSVLSKLPKLDCNAQNTLLSDEQIKINVKTFEDSLNVNASLIMTTISKKTSCGYYGCTIKNFDVPTIYENVSDETLNTAAEMFTYLNYCPPKLLLSFYKGGVQLIHKRLKVQTNG